MKPRPCVLIDTREQAPLRFSDAVDAQRATLLTGDYSVAGASDRVAIERKSLPDLVACCGPERERFLDCCRRLQAYEHRAVIVEAAVDDVLAHAYRSRLLPQCVIGTTIAIFVDYGVPVIWAGDARNAANITERLLTRIWRKAVNSNNNASRGTNSRGVESDREHEKRNPETRNRPGL